ncbi:hypothetical protein QNI16_26685 [Cytophagaceae bacterium YF14B1]|uniref:Uncharacterized protein n=1 Tax=Xanthocytophaga flava TaxID=3048013 RepID=A0AAE3UB78_9BACT|nr:hypothetical protein [Xanthocytophaga flavus]MDJ1484113.1 hypothetical protein [Xanthocytophaga flavus]
MKLLCKPHKLIKVIVIVFLVRIVLIDQCVEYLTVCRKQTIKKFESKSSGMGNMSHLHMVAELLGSIAFSFELNQLAKAKDPTLKCYAFWLLAKRNEKSMIKDLLRENRKDTSAIYYSGPCIGWDTQVCELMVEIVTWGNRFPLTQILNQEDLQELGIKDQNIVATPLGYEYVDCCRWESILFGFFEVVLG